MATHSVSAAISRTSEQPRTAKAPTPNPSKLPRAARGVIGIMQSMGVERYEPIVMHQLMDFQHRYISELCRDAQALADHARHPSIQRSDVLLAIENRVASTYTEPPSKDFLLNMASEKNAEPLPLDSLPEKAGVYLPLGATHTLARPGYQVALEEEHDLAAGSASGMAAPHELTGDGTGRRVRMPTSPATATVRGGKGGGRRGSAKGRKTTLGSGQKALTPQFWEDGADTEPTTSTGAHKRKRGSSADDSR